MSALPTFTEIRFRAMREKTTVTEDVLLADDSIATVRFGPRGGHKIVKPK